jgi:pimeloyl-ACP methyl ester carboxylesterase
MPAAVSHLLPILGRKLGYYERGSGPCVLLVHGLGSASHMWSRIELPGCRLVAVDLPGCGRSQRRFGRQGPRELAVLLGALMEQIAEGPFSIVGHSLGGLVAAEIALAEPGRVRALGLIDVPAPLPPLAKVPAAPLVGETLTRLASLAPVSRRAVRAWLSLVFGRRGAVTDELIEEYQRGASARGYFAATLAGLRGLAAWDRSSNLEAITVPSAIVWGTRDRLIPIEAGHRLAQLMPAATFHPIEGCGHSPPEESPAEVSAVLQALLERAGVLCAREERSQK